MSILPDYNSTPAVSITHKHRPQSVTYPGPYLGVDPFPHPLLCRLKLILLLGGFPQLLDARRLDEL
jgi:hypothetical protein